MHLMTYLQFQHSSRIYLLGVVISKCLRPKFVAVILSGRHRPNHTIRFSLRYSNSCRGKRFGPMSAALHLQARYFHMPCALGLSLCASAVAALASHRRFTVDFVPRSLLRSRGIRVLRCSGCVYTPRRKPWSAHAHRLRWCRLRSLPLRFG